MEKSELPCLLLELHDNGTGKYLKFGFDIVYSVCDDNWFVKSDFHGCW